MKTKQLAGETDLTHEEVRRLEKEYVLHAWTSQKSWDAPVMVDGHGCYLRDMDGNEILDFKSTSICSNLGHAHPKVVEAINDQAKKVAFISETWGSIPRMKMAKKLVELSPKNMGKVFFTLAGAEAIENALKIARAYTGKQKVITRYRSYHGASAGAMTLGGDPRRWAMEPGIPGVVRAPDCYCYRCPFGLEDPSCGLRCAEYFADLIELEGPNSVAAVLVEPIVGSSGCFVPPDGYLARLREICTQNNILLIFDEIMVGLGRTGAMFASEHWNVMPDMICLAKGLASAYIPLGAVVVSKEIAEYFDENMLFAGLTFAGHDLACAAGLATLEAYEEEHIIDHTKQLGNYMQKRMCEMKDRHPSIGDVRGKGLYGVIELVRDKKTKERLSPWTQHSKPDALIKKIVKKAYEEGVCISARWNYIYCAPPLIITKTELDKALDVIDEVLKLADAEVND